MAARLFEKIPEHLFSVLASPNRDTYAKALFVIHDAFRHELVIHRESLTASLMDSLSADIEGADFSGDMTKEEQGEDLTSFSGKAHFLIRKLHDCGWIDFEYERGSFEEVITVPDYSIRIIDVLYGLTVDVQKEYNSYVYATYAALKNADATPEYRFQALESAYHNTENLIDELKTLYNNIRRYFQRMESEMDANALLDLHFQEYKKKIIDAVLYPLKTMDSVPRFRTPIQEILNDWSRDDRVLLQIVNSGIHARVFSDEEAGHEETMRMITWIIDEYDNLDGLLAAIDSRHTQYTVATMEKIRYELNVDNSARGKLAHILKNAGDPDVLHAMQEGLRCYRHQYVANGSLYTNVKRTKRSEGKPLAASRANQNPEAMKKFLERVRNQYPNRRIDQYILSLFQGKDTFTTIDAPMKTQEEFILFLLGTIRANEKSAPYTVTIYDTYVMHEGCSLPSCVFEIRKGSAAK